MEGLKKKKVSDLQIPGIYFLFKDGDLVYIGQSKDVFARIRNHAWPTSKTKHAYRGGFDEYATLEVKDTNKRVHLEKMYIERYRPEGNRLESRNRRKFLDQLTPGFSAPTLHRT